MYRQFHRGLWRGGAVSHRKGFGADGCLGVQARWQSFLAFFFFCLSPWHHAAPSWRAADSHSPTHQCRHRVGACPCCRRRQIRTRLWWRIWGCFQSLICENGAGLARDFPRGCMKGFISSFWRDFGYGAAALSPDKNDDIGRFLGIHPTSVHLLLTYFFAEFLLTPEFYKPEVWLPCRNLSYSTYSADDQEIMTRLIDLEDNNPTISTILIVIIPRLLAVLPRSSAAQSWISTCWSVSTTLERHLFPCPLQTFPLCHVVLPLPVLIIHLKHMSQQHHVG